MMSLTCGLNFLGSCQSLGFASVELPDDQKKGGIHQKTLEKIKMYVKFVHAWSSVILLVVCHDKVTWIRSKA